MAAAFAITNRFQVGSWEVIELTWTTHSDETLSGALSAAVRTVEVAGLLYEVEPNPGTAAPTAAYDPSFTSPGGYDVLQGMPDSLSATATERHHPLTPATDGTTITALPPVCIGAYVFDITNGGSGKSGVTTLFFRK